MLLGKLPSHVQRVATKRRGLVVGYVILIVVVLVLVIVAATLTRRRGTARGVSYGASPDTQLVSRRDVSPKPVLTPEASTQEIVNREFVADTSDDLLDPRNPRHAQWVQDHPDVETDEEYLAEHPEDAPKPPES
jgi:hypothetical protein